MEMNTPTRKQFVLSRIKFDKENKGVEIGFVVNNTVGADMFYDKQMVHSAKLPHPDMIVKMNALLPILLASIGRIENNDSINNYRMTGINVSGDNGVIMTATYLCKNETKISVLSPRIRLDKDVWDFEKELSEAVYDLSTEAYLYVFEGKQAQLMIEFGEAGE